MRLITILLLTVALATSAGCFGKDKGDDTNPTTTPTGGATPPTSTTKAPTGATPTNPTANNTPTTPPKPAPKELCAVSGSFSQNIQPGAPPTMSTTTACGAVTAGYTTATVNVTFTATSGAPVFLTNDLSLSLVDSTGAATATCTGPPPGPATAPLAVTCTGPVTVGDYSLKFQGAGDVDVTGNVMIA
ncbi:MAG TPA: hypothetical protein VM370_13520 [Candidatus Thermoplasmatota archaeon]|nr:hypothetical protein [Candidatus Thermoplasmatota archaeon]